MGVSRDVMNSVDQFIEEYDVRNLTKQACKEVGCHAASIIEYILEDIGYKDSFTKEENCYLQDRIECFITSSW